MRRSWYDMAAAGLVFILAGFTLAGCCCYGTSAPGTVLGGAPQGHSRLNRIVTFEVVGKGVEPESALTKGQARLMAERAAVADGYRLFVEKLKGVYVEAAMRAGFGSVDRDMVRTYTQSLLRGVSIQSITHGDYGIARAVMTLRVNFTRYRMVWWPEGLEIPGGRHTVASLERDSIK